MKKISVLIALFLTIFLFTACNQSRVAENPASGEAEPTAVTGDHSSPPVQLIFYSFEELKTFASLPDDDLETLMAYVEDPEISSRISWYRLDIAAAICAKQLDIIIPCADRFENVSVDMIYMDEVNISILVWYDIGDYRYCFSCYPKGTGKAEERIQEEYEADNVLYRSQTPDKIIYAYDYEKDNSDGLYSGQIHLEDIQMYFDILRDVDEETGEYKDGGNIDVDLSQMEQFEFVQLREVLDKMA